MILTGLLLACLPLVPFADDLLPDRRGFSEPCPPGAAVDLSASPPPAAYERADSRSASLEAADPNDSGSVETPAVDEAAAPPGAYRRFFKNHGWHLIVSLGADQVAEIYDRSVGPSDDPLILGDPPGIDEWVRKRFKSSKPLTGFVEDYGLEALKYAAPIAMIMMDLSDRSNLLPDFMGFLETFFTNRAATSLLKQIVGRERPKLEFAEEEGATPSEIAALDADEGNHESFPSGHSSGSFAFASYIERAVARRMGLDNPWRYASFTGFYGLAGAISISRIRRDKHFFTDIVAGAAMGTFIARAYYRVNHSAEFAGKESDRAGNAHSRWRVRLASATVARSGVGVTLSILPPGAS